MNLTLFAKDLELRIPQHAFEMKLRLQIPRSGKSPIVVNTPINVLIILIITLTVSDIIVFIAAIKVSIRILLIPSKLRYLDNLNVYCNALWREIVLWISYVNVTYIVTRSVHRISISHKRRA